MAIKGDNPFGVVSVKCKKCGKEGSSADFYYTDEHDLYEDQEYEFLCDECFHEGRDGLSDCY
jgi:hypothetical protein